MGGITRYEVFVAGAYGGLYAAAKPAEMGDYVLHSDHEAEVARLRAEAEKNRVDAERYRWLRDEPWRGNEDLEPVIRLQLNALWDERIDAAMGEGK